MNFVSSTALGPDHLNVANRVPRTEAEGPGWRFALWVQGCPLRCPGCCNPHMLSDTLAELVAPQTIVREILDTPQIEGVTFIGGEPFWQAGALAKVAQEVRQRGLSVMVFTGMTLGRIKRADRPDWNALLQQTDLLVDGPYIQRLHTDTRRWIGSTNQRTHVLTDRYAGLSEQWDVGANTIELRMKGAEITINGFPHQSIVDLAAQSIRKKES